MADKNYNIVLSATDETRAAFDSMRKNIEDVQAPLLSFQNLAAAAGATALTAMIKSSIDAGDELFMLSQKTGIAVENLAGLELAAKMNGASLESVAMGVKKLSSYLYDASTGTQVNVDTLKALGITAKEPLPAMEQLADKFATMNDGAEKSALAVKLFGKAGTDMIPMLDQGSAALRDMIEEGQRLNPVTTEFAANANNFNDNLDRIATRAKGNAMIMANELLPALNNIAEAFLSVSTHGDEMKAVGAAIETVLQGMVIGAAGVVYIFKEVGAGLYGLSQMAVAAAHGNFAEAGKIHDEMLKNAEEDKNTYGKFIDDILKDQEKLAAAPAQPQTSNAVANELEALEARRAAIAELQKMNDASDKYDIEHAKKNYEEHVKQMDTLSKKDSDYFQSLRDKMQDMGKSQLQIDQDAQQRELQALAVQREIMATDHELSLGELQQFEEARLNIIELHKKQEEEMGKANMLQLLATAGTQFRAMFELQKVANLAQAVSDGYTAVQAAYKWGSIEFGGPVGGAAMAAIAMAATAANIMAIQSASFGGGTGASGAGGGGGGAPLTTSSPLAPAPTPASIDSTAVPAQSVNITIAGNDQSVFTYDQVVNQLIPAINQAAGNGVNINVNLSPT